MDISKLPELLTDVGTKLVLAKAAIESLKYFGKINPQAVGDLAERMIKWSPWRKKNADAFFGEFYARVNPIGSEPRGVAPRFLLDAVDCASQEENEQLRAMWASLLANAVDPEEPEIAYLGFAEVLRQLTPNEAKVLELIYDSEDSWRGVLGGLNNPDKEATGNLGRGLWHPGDVLFGNLCRLELLATEYKAMTIREVITLDDSDFTVVSDELTDFKRTAYGKAFLDACRRTPKEPERLEGK